MTREQNFRTSFIPQLTAYSGWQSIPHDEIKKLPLSSFPVFCLDPGKTKYTQYDPLGKAIAGEQEFTVTVYYALPLRSPDTAYLDHSDITNILEQFINAPAFVPPVLLPGDTCCIGRCKLTGSNAPAIAFGDTRFAAGVSGTYTFTLF